MKMISFTKPKKESEKIFSAIQEGLARLDKENVNRAVIYLAETEPRRLDSWVEANMPRYHDFEVLDYEERKLINEKKSYVVVSLVLPEFTNSKFPYGYLEHYQRTRLGDAFRPKLIDSSALNYDNHGGQYYGEHLEQICRYYTEQGWTPEVLKRALDHGINNYKARTRELIANNDPLQLTLKAIQERNCSPFDQIMQNLRSRIGVKK